MKMEKKQIIELYTCFCNKCCNQAEFHVSERYMLCNNCGYEYDAYNHEDDMPELGEKLTFWKILEKERLQKEKS